MNGTTLSSGHFASGEFVRPLVRTAVGDDADDAVAAEDLAHLIERIEGRGLLVVVQMRVEDFDPLLLHEQRRVPSAVTAHCATQELHEFVMSPLSDRARTLTHR